MITQLLTCIQLIFTNLIREKRCFVECNLHKMASLKFHVKGDDRDQKIYNELESQNLAWSNYSAAVQHMHTLMNDLKTYIAVNDRQSTKSTRLSEQTTNLTAPRSTQHL